jgi:SOS-response transcriptional repressor LexA
MYRTMPPHFRRELEARRELHEAHQIPLFRAADVMNPLDVTFRREKKWEGRYVYRSPEMSGAYTFAFLIEDDAMAPKFNKGDIVYCEEIRARVEDGKPVVACVKDVTRCRILERQGSLWLFKPVNASSRLVTCRKEDVKWCYRVVRRMSVEE